MSVIQYMPAPKIRETISERIKWVEVYFRELIIDFIFPGYSLILIAEHKFYVII